MRYHIDGGEPKKDRCGCGNIVPRGEVPCRPCLRDAKEAREAAAERQRREELIEEMKMRYSMWGPYLGGDQ